MSDLQDYEPTIRAILTISSNDLLSAIHERIGNSKSFTHTIDVASNKIQAKTLCLLRIPEPYSSYGDDPTPVTFLGILRKGQKVSTGQTRIKIDNIIRLPATSFEEFVIALPKRFKPFLETYSNAHYAPLSPKMGVGLYEVLLQLCPTEFDEINEVAEKAYAKVSVRHSPISTNFAAQKDAVGIALDIFGIDRSDTLSKWSGGKTFGNSFLNGLYDNAVLEDHIINHDHKTFPGWENVSDSLSGIATFQNNEDEELTIISANRTPLELALGVDLIYFHKTHNSFVLVQYKMMDKRGEDSEKSYFDPNQGNHDVELDRMNNLMSLINEIQWSDKLPDFRISRCPIFFKLCRKLDFKSDNQTIAAGAYLSLDHWNLLLNDNSIMGPKGGKQIGFHTLNRRYIGTQMFVELVQKGFFGTQEFASQKIALVIEDILANGKSIIYAIQDKVKNPRRSQRSIADELGFVPPTLPIDDDDESDLPF